MKSTRRPRGGVRFPATRSIQFEPLEQRTLLSLTGLNSNAAPAYLGSGNALEPDLLPGRWITRFDGIDGSGDQQIAALDRRFDLAGISGVEISRPLGLPGMVSLRTSPDVSYAQLAAKISQVPGFRYLTPDYKIHGQATYPNDPLFGELWGMENTGQLMPDFFGGPPIPGTPGADISVVEAWDLTTGSSSVVVGVIDSGIDFTHPDLIDNIWTNPGEIPDNGIDDDGNGFIDDDRGWDFWDFDNDPTDENGHGTHVSGTIGASGNNGVGVVGVNWDVTIMPIRFLGPGNSGTFEGAVAAVNYATMMRNNGVNLKVTNNSWGAYFDFAPLADAIAAHEAAGILFVAAAGNDANNNDSIPFFPAGYGFDNVVSVASTDNLDNLSVFSNYGATTVDLAAPGSAILSTVPGGYAYYFGTSMASPHVAGVAALAWSLAPNATYQEIKAALFAGVDPLPALSGITVTGGRLNAYNTLQQLGLSVTSTDPAVGSTVSAAPSTFVVNLSGAYDPTSIDASDFTVNGIPADSFTLDDADTITFTYAVSPVTAEGLQTMEIAPGAIAPAPGGLPFLGFAGTFRYDTVLLQVVATNPPYPGGVFTLPAPLPLDVFFNEPVDPGSVSPTDLIVGGLAGATVTGAVVAPDGLTVRFTISGVTGEGTLGATLPDGVITDVHGNPGTGFSATYAVDFGTVAYPVPLTPVAPLGSLIYDPSVQGIIDPAGDTDRFTLNVDPGQTITVLVTVPSGMYASVGRLGLNGGSVLLVDPTNGSSTLLGKPTPDNAGLSGLAFTSDGRMYGTSVSPGSASTLLRIDPATGGLLQSIGTITDGPGGPGISIGDLAVQPGTNVLYGVRSNTAGGGGGFLYTIDANTGVATFVGDTGAGVGGGLAFAPNGTLYQSAFNSFFDFTSLNTLNPSNAARIATVALPAYYDALGVSPDGVIFASDGGPNPGIYTINPVNGAVTFVGNSTAGGPSDLAFAAGSLRPTVTLTDNSTGSVVASATADAAGAAALIQTFRVPGQLDTGGAPRTYTVTVGGAGGTTGAYTTKIVLNAALETETYFGPDNNIRSRAQNLDGSFIALQGANNPGNSPQPRRGAVLGELKGGETDWYSYQLSSGQSTTVALTGLNGRNVDVALVAPNGIYLALGAANASNVGEIISNYLATSTGTYSLRVTGDAGATYSLVVTRNATFDTEANSSIATAQDLSSPEVAARRWAMGYVQGGSDPFSLTGTPVFGSLVLAGANMRLGINSDGSFVTSDLSAGIEFLGTEFVIPGTPLASFSIARDGFSYTNSAPAFWSDIPVTIEDLSTGSLRGARVVGLVGGNLLLERVVLFEEDADFATIATRVTNLSDATMNDVAWLESLDPDQGVPFGLSFDTSNDVVFDGRFVRASAFPGAYPNGLTIGLGTQDPRGVLSAQGFFNTFPYDIINSPQDPNGAFGDIAINGAFNFGSLGAGQSTSGILVMAFGRSIAEADATYTANADGTQTADSDFHRIAADGNKTIEIETQTPAGQSGEFVNILDPVIRLYDAAGNLLATNDNGAPDGRNAKLSYRVPAGAGGIFFVEVAASDATEQPTKGEYILSVKGAKAPSAAPFEVTSTVPVDGGVVYAPPSQITVNVNDAVLLPTLQGTDLTVDGVQGRNATPIDGDTAVFDVLYAYEYNGRYYALTKSATTWTDAQAQAREIGGNLVTVNSQEENDFLQRVFFSGPKSREIYWIGLNDAAQEGDFVWVSGEPVTYTNWHAGEPNDFDGEDYAAINWHFGVGADSIPGTWNDTPNGGAVIAPYYGIVELTSLPARYVLATEGTHTVSIAAGAFQDVQGTPIQAYTGTFTIDYTAPRVVSSSIQQGQALAGGFQDLTFTIGFSEAMDTTFVDSSDVSLVGQVLGTFRNPSAISFDATGTVLTIRFDGVFLQEDLYTLTLQSGDFGFQDLVGLDLDGETPNWPIPPNVSGNGLEGGNFAVSFVVDTATREVPVPLVPINPLGSLIYRTPFEASGVITPGDDGDDWTINLDAGQTITVLLSAGFGLAASVEILAPDGTTLGSATAGGPDQTVLLQTVPASAAGIYTFRLSGGAGSTGSYSFQLFVNAALEEEAYGGPSNDDIGSAQDIDPSFIPLPGGGDRGAVLGVADGAGDYEATALPFAFTDISTTGTPVLEGSDDGQAYLGSTDLGGFEFSLAGMTANELYVSANGYVYFPFSAGYGYVYAMARDLYVFSPPGAVYWQVIGSGDEQQLVIQWNNVGFYYYPDADPVTFQMILSEADGSIQFNYLDLQTNLEFANEGLFSTVGMEAYDSSTGTYTSLLLPTFDVPNEYVGTGRSTQIAAQPPTGDYYAFSLGSGQSASVGLTGLSTGVDFVLQIQDASGNVLAEATGGSADYTALIDAFVAPATGTYYVYVSGSTVGDYSLVVTRDAVLEIENNDTPESGQSLDLSGGSSTVLGHATGSGTSIIFAAVDGFFDVIAQINVSTGEIVGLIPAPIPVGNGPDGLGYDGGSLFLVNSYWSDELWELDPVTGAVIDVDSLGTGFDFIDGVAVLNGLVYILNSATSQILVFDPVTDTIVNVLSPTFGLVGGLAALSGPDALVATRDASSVVLIDPTTGAILNEFFPFIGGIYGVGTVDGQILLGGFSGGIYTFTRDGIFVTGVGFPYVIWGIGADNLASTPPADYYTITIGEGETLSIRTATPGGGPGEFINTLDPILRVYDAEGNLVAEDDNSDPDGRNAWLSGLALPAGTYSIALVAAAGTSGEYTLSVTVAPAPAPARLALARNSSVVGISRLDATAAGAADIGGSVAREAVGGNQVARPERGPAAPGSRVAPARDVAAVDLVLASYESGDDFGRFGGDESTVLTERFGTRRRIRR